MRTDRSPERDVPPSNSDAAAAAVSRRGFVLASGMLACVGLGGTVGATSRGRPRTVDVTATGPYVESVRALVRAFDPRTIGVDVQVHPVGRSRPGRSLDVEPDVRISGCPVPTVERDGTTEHDDSVEGDVMPERNDWTLHDVSISGRGVLAHPDGGWREVLRRRDVRRRWASDVPVETWSESDWASVTDGGGEVGDPARSTGIPDGDVRSRARRALAEPAILVRGTRAYQYAEGRGGVGYYRVDPSAIEPDAGDRAVARDAHTPVVRLEYVHVAEQARSDHRVVAFLEHYTGNARTAPGTAAHFADPAVETDG